MLDRMNDCLRAMLKASRTTCIRCKPGLTGGVIALN